jgi:hypothetical protein
MARVGFKGRFPSMLGMARVGFKGRFPSTLGNR